MKMEQTRYRDARGPRGRIERITYQATNVKGETLEKHANVYLPAGYDADAEQRYNVFYLMHGGGGNEDAWLDSCPVKNVLDRLNAEGRLAPTIVVFPTYYTRGNTPEGADFRTAGREEILAFQPELTRNLVPAVESRYRSFAKSVDEAGLRSSRMHRGFGGFSMGGGNTWMTFTHNLASFGWFMPLSGDCWEIETMGGRTRSAETAELLKKVVIDGGFGPRDYFIYALTGSEDIALDNLTPQIEAMKAHAEQFRLTEDFASGNLRFEVADAFPHAYEYVVTYVERALPVFFRP